MIEPPGEVTRLLAELKNGNNDALGKLMPLVYRELRRLAAHYLRAERVGHTLQPTALVHEAYLRLVAQDRTGWQNREQFVGIAAQLMRRVLVDYARGRATGKRSAGAIRIDAGKIDLELGGPQLDEIVAVDEAVKRLGELDPQQGRVVELRYFAGLTVAETAKILGISERSVKRDWAMAAAWLRSELSPRAAP